jgi:8-oxo-dGTP diphosphatase
MIFSRKKITLFVTAEIKSGKIQNMEPEKCEKLEWFTWNNFPKPLFIPVKNLREQGYDPFN